VSASFAPDAIAGMRQLSQMPPCDFLARSAPLPSNHRLLDQTSIEEFQELALLRQRVDNLNRLILRQLARSIYVALALHTLSKLSSMGHNQQLRVIEVDRHQELVMDHGSDEQVI
jgi:hypothetical protein